MNRIVTRRVRASRAHHPSLGVLRSGGVAIRRRRRHRRHHRRRLVVTAAAVVVFFSLLDAAADLPSRPIAGDAARQPSRRRSPE